ncbi:hypothetical protein BDZ45DRAFT_82988 [Acephala macrosclerotiorum]|nr:hypothetical protein BDZ45DRAFT_82988 [Acephala macrosclerotiorum]
MQILYLLRIVATPSRCRADASSCSRGQTHDQRGPFRGFFGTEGSVRGSGARWRGDLGMQPCRAEKIRCSRCRWRMLTAKRSRHKSRLALVKITSGLIGPSTQGLIFVASTSTSHDHKLCHTREQHIVRNPVRARVKHKTLLNGTITK